MFFENNNNHIITKPIFIKELLQSVNIEITHIDYIKPAIIEFTPPTSPITILENETIFNYSQTNIPKKIIGNNGSNKKNFMTYTYRIGNRSQRYFSRRKFNIKMI